MNKVEIHNVICKKLNETYAAKNHDYGDSFSKTRKEFPDAICVRLTDKLERIKMLKKVNNKVLDESLADTYLDMANYCIMELVEMAYNKTESNQTVIEEK